MTESYAKFLEKIPLFSGLNESERSLLSDYLVPVSVRKDELLFSAGDPGDALYIILEGAVEIFVLDHSGNQVTLITHKEGELFGELSLLDDGPRTASAEAKCDSNLLTLNKEAFILFLVGAPHAAIPLIAMIAGRLRTANQVIQKRHSINFNQQIENKLTLVQKFAFKSSAFIGSFSFLLLNMLFVTTWVVLNLPSVGIADLFDPFPFSTLSFLISIEALLLSIVVLYAQNLQAATDKIRTDIEYETNVRSEQEITSLHEKVDSMRGDILIRLHRVESSLKKRDGAESSEKI